MHVLQAALKSMLRNEVQNRERFGLICVDSFQLIGEFNSNLGNVLKASIIKGFYLTKPFGNGMILYVNK